jgi:hypothetical protein
MNNICIDIYEVLNFFYTLSLGDPAYDRTYRVYGCPFLHPLRKIPHDRRKPDPQNYPYPQHLRMDNHPNPGNPAHPGKEEGDPRAGEETCTTTMRRSRAGQTDHAEKFSR